MSRLQGDWRSGEAWLDGNAISPFVIAGRTYGFSWGSHSEGSVRLALAILRRFYRWESAVDMACAFSREFIAELPQGDFGIDIDVPAWGARRLARRRKREKAPARQSGAQCSTWGNRARPAGGMPNGAAR